MKVKAIKNTPWLVPVAIDYLRLKMIRIIELGGSLKVIETGSGGSTLFFAEFADQLLSFEHSRKWFNLVDKELEGYDRTRIELRFDPDYPAKGLRYIDSDYDIALIDGRGRVKSIASVVSRIKDGGYLILDNAERPRYKIAVKALNLAFKERIVFEKDWTTTFWRIQNKKKR